MTGVATALLAASPPGDASAATPVEARTVLEVDRIDELTTTALPDGRALVGWVNGNNNGDTTLAMVRPSGAVLGPTAQTIRQGFASRRIGFLPGGPAAAPVLTWFQDGVLDRPFHLSLNGDRFGVPTEAFVPNSGLSGHDASYARCPDGSTVLGFQFSHNPGTTRQTHTAYAGLGDAAGKLDDPLPKVTSQSLDSGQQPTVACDRTNSPTLSLVNDHDAVGKSYGEHILVRNVRVEDEILLNRPLPVGIDATAPDARFAPDGRLWLVWTESKGGAGGVTYVATRAPGKAGPVSAPVVLDATATHVGPLFFGAGGSTHLLVQHQDPDGKIRIGVRTAPPGAAAFGPEERLLDPDLHFGTVLTDHPDGRPRLLVRRVLDRKTGASTFAVGGIPAAGTTDPLTPVEFGVSGGRAATTYLPSGDLLIVGNTTVGSDRVQLREGGLDTGAPPTVDGVAVPGTALVGEPVTMSAVASDPLGLASFTWSVDSTTLTSQRATHTFTKPGSYVATARAVDRAGIATEVTRTIRVVDPDGQGAEDGRNAGNGAGSLPDRAAPTLTKASAQRGRKGRSARTVSLRVTPSEAVALDVELLGTERRKAKRQQIVLRSTRIGTAKAGLAATAKLKLPAKLPRTLGRALSVRVTATDLAGNRTTRTVKVKRAKR